MHIPLKRLMEAAGIENAHALHVRSGGRIPMTTAYRLVRSGGKLEKWGALLEALCDTLGVPPSALLEHGESPKVKRPASSRHTRP